MTSHFNRRIVCAICGDEAEHALLGSTNAFGPYDLDLRPPPMARHTMQFWVQACPTCGYTAADISKAKEMLGYVPQMGLVEGLRAQLEWQRNVRRLKI